MNNANILIAIAAYKEADNLKCGIIIFDDFGICCVDGIKKFIYKIEQKISGKNFSLKII